VKERQKIRDIEEDRLLRSQGFAVSYAAWTLSLP
jgi:hypothetical protein